MSGQKAWYAVLSFYSFKEIKALQPFEQITALTDVAEGTIVRVITRLDETCREVRDAARVIGDADLFKKMEESQIKIKRDSTWEPFRYLCNLES
jgi:superfamily II RNA helicase